MATNAIVDVGWIIWLRAAGIDTVAHGCLPNSCTPNNRLEIVNHPVKEIKKNLRRVFFNGLLGLTYSMRVGGDRYLFISQVALFLTLKELLAVAEPTY